MTSFFSKLKLNRDMHRKENFSLKINFALKWKIIICLVFLRNLQSHFSFTKCSFYVALQDTLLKPMLGRYYSLLHWDMFHLIRLTLSILEVVHKWCLGLWRKISMILWRQCMYLNAKKRDKEGSRYHELCDVIYVWFLKWAL